MRIEDRVRRTLSGQADRVRANEDAWSSIHRRLDDRRHRRRLAQLMAAVVTLGLSVGSVLWLWTAFRPGSHHPVGQTSPSSPAPISPSASVTATIPLRTGPHTGPVAITSGEGGVWVAEIITGCSGEIIRIDPGTNSIAARIPLGFPSDVTVGGGSVWAAGGFCSNGQSVGAVYRIDPETNRVVATIPLGCVDDPKAGGCFTSEIVTSNDSVWVTLNLDPTGGEVVRIDPATGKVTARIPVKGWPRDIVVGDGSVWLQADTQFSGSDVLAGSLLRVDPATDALDTVLRNRLTVLAGSESPPAIVEGQGSIWTMGSGGLMRVDEATGLVGAPQAPSSGPTWPFAVDDAGVWFVGWPSGAEGGWAVNHLDLQSGQIDASTQFDATPVDATLDPSTNTIWVADYGPNVVRIDLG